ncbi:MAG: Rrf2 family transcriptional regulator [Eubacteriales bacterium]|nr:Rrf2 family transcriptional regulator [Eubacteriales bacterium]
MFITRECDYAVRVLRALAGEKRLSVNEICEKEVITAPFAYKILKKLQKAKMVRGYRGVHGGYTLNKSMGDMTLFDVYSAISPDMFIIECMNPKKQCVRDGQNGQPCLMHAELVSIQDELWRMLKRKSLKEILELSDDGEPQVKSA